MRGIDLAFGYRRRQRRGVLTAGSTTVLFGLLLVLIGCGQPETARQVPATSTLSGVLMSVQMITAKVGWAISWDVAGNGAYRILKTVDGGHEWQTLLQCETEVLRFLAQGHANRQISHTLHNNAQTVKTHVSHILAKLGCRAASRTLYAIRIDLDSPDASETAR